MKWPWTNSMRGSATGPVVQAGTIHGDVYLNAPDPAHEADPVLIVTTTVSTAPPSATRLLHDPRQRAMQIEILVQTRSAQAVVLHDLRPAFTQYPPPGYPLSAAATYGSPLEVRDMRIDLASPAPRPHILEGPGFPFKVTAADPEMFRVVLVAGTTDAVTLELTWTCADRSGITPIDHDGFPFSVDNVHGTG